MKKLLLCLSMFICLVFAGCDGKSDDSLSYLNEVLETYGNITVRCGNVEFSLSDGRTEFLYPDVIKGLTVFDGNAKYGDIVTPASDEAFYISNTLKNALEDFSSCDSCFVKNGNGAKYEGVNYDIYIDNYTMPKEMIIVSGGSNVLYEIISINK